MFPILFFGARAAPWKSAVLFSFLSLVEEKHCKRVLLINSWKIMLTSRQVSWLHSFASRDCTVLHCLSIIYASLLFASLQCTVSLLLRGWMAPLLGRLAWLLWWCRVQEALNAHCPATGGALWCGAVWSSVEQCGEKWREVTVSARRARHSSTLSSNHIAWKAEPEFFKKTETGKSVLLLERKSPRPSVKHVLKVLQ